MFVHKFGRFRYKRLVFGAAPAGDLFQRKIDEIFKDLSNVFSIADGILVLGNEVDGRNHDETLQRGLQMYRQVNLELKKDKCHVRCASVPFLVKSYLGMV